MPDLCSDNFWLSPAEVDYIVGQCGASVLLVDSELEEALSGIKVRHLFVLAKHAEADLMRFDTEPDHWASPTEESAATINYTSGTTARP